MKPVPIEQRKGFVFTGRLVNLKRVDRIIGIYSRLSREIRQENALYIVGDGYCRNQLEDQVKFLKLDSQVIFMGNQPNEDIMKIVSTKKILLMASTTEGFPTSVAEAFSVGVPVVTTDVGSVSSVVVNNDNGFCITKDFEDSEYLKCIEAVLNDYARFADSAFDNARLFNAESVTKGIIEDINKELAGLKSSYNS